GAGGGQAWMLDHALHVQIVETSDAGCDPGDPSSTVLDSFSDLGAYCGHVPPSSGAVRGWFDGSTGGGGEVAMAYAYPFHWGCVSSITRANQSPVLQSCDSCPSQDNGFFGNGGNITLSIGGC